jgi:hypothetical protein
MPHQFLPSFILSALVSLFGSMCFGTASAAENRTPQYLLFQIFTGNPDPNSGIYKRSRPKEDILGIVTTISATIRPPTSDPDRLLGFSIGPITMDEGAEGAKADIRDAFDIALATDMAVAIHLDDYMFWTNARWPDGRLLRASDETTEWKDWSRTPAEGLSIGWMQNVKLAPQICYESPAAKQFVTYWTRNIIGKEVKTQYDRLVTAGKTKLFAGVMVGWESNLAAGYCSLSYLGYTEQKPPRDFDHERERILQRNVERWAKGVFESGIPAGSIYTHLAPISKQQYRQLSSMLPPSRLREIPQSTAFRAHWTAFNAYSRPGFSVYPADGLFEDIYQAIDSYGRGPWAMTEGANVVLGPNGPGPSPLTWEAYLARNFNHGAKIVNLFGAFQGDRVGEFRRATENPEALDAYRKFLQGAQLVESSRQ